MADFEVQEPILNNPFEKPAAHWLLREGHPPEKKPGRRPSGYWYRDPSAGRADAGNARGIWREMALVNLIRDRIEQWRADGRPGVTRTTAELLQWWVRDGRQQRLFFAQIEAAEAIIFLTEARRDYLDGIEVPWDEPSEDLKAQGIKAFRRYCAKLATGSGKTTVMAMIAGWSILNKVNNRSDARFSDLVLVICPNVTIRSRLGELDPAQGEASLYRTRDLVPPALMPDLAKGRLVITNWHAFEPQQPGLSGGARVVKAGIAQECTEWVMIAGKKTTFRGKRYFTPEAYEAAIASGALTILKEERAADGSLKQALVRSTRYVESDTALVARVLGRAQKGNILVMNDEAHHAYRIPPKVEEEDEDGLFDDDEEDDEEADRKEATVWVEGLDRIHKLRGINMCVDLSATPYYLGRMGGQTNTVFPWAISDFALTDAIESGLTKIPQLVARGPSGELIESYFNVWRWILSKLTASERGAKQQSPKPEAVLKWAHSPIAILGGLWSELREEWAKSDDPRPPVFILVCKNKRIAKAIHEWIGEDIKPAAVPSLGLPDLRNRPGKQVTIRVDTGVVHETDSGHAKSDETAWMRLTLDTVGRMSWPVDSQGRQIYPKGFVTLAEKLKRPLHPPGRDIRCIISVGMLTEGWDCNTVTHVVGLRPFQSQLLCEQVVGRALRRRRYDIGDNGKFDEEVAKVFGVPFEIVPFKGSAGTPKPKPPQRRIYAVPEKKQFAIMAPRVNGYSQGVRNRIVVDWAKIASLKLDPMQVPPETEMAAALNAGRPSIHSPGGLHAASLKQFRARHRIQELAFQMARDLTRSYVAQPTCEAPAHVLFPQIMRIVQRYIDEKVQPGPPAQRIDAFVSPYYGWIIERLVAAIRPDIDAGEAPELPDVERDRPCRTADINAWTGKEVREVIHSHVNAVVSDTIQWEQSAAYHLDRHEAVEAFVKNFGLNFTIPYFDNGQPHDYLPDFIVRLKGEPARHLIVEIKGADWDGKTDIKAQAARRWCDAVNAAGAFGEWDYVLITRIGDLINTLDALQSTEATAA